MSSDSDEDFGDLDICNSAATRVLSNWTKSFDKTEIEKNVLKKPISVGSEEVVTPTKKSKKGKENSKKANSKKASCTIDDNSDDDDDDVIVTKSGSNQVNITPPASPLGTPASAKGANSRAVRGANRTKKTQQALQKLQTAHFRQPKGRPLSRNTSINGDDSLLETVDLEDDDSFELKIRWKAQVIRLSVQPADRMGKVMDRLAEEVGKQPGDVVLYGGGEPLKREDTVTNLGLSIVSVLEARPKVDVHKTDDRIEIKLQSKDRRATVMVKIKPMDNMKFVMEEYAKKSGISLDTLKFTFDGEELDPEETAESLDLEGGECIDVAERKK